MTDKLPVSDWRKIPQSTRPYDAYRRGQYTERDCDHHGPYCKCDTPYWLRESLPIEQAHEARIRESILIVEEGEGG
jgi:hypothetical protein